MQPQVWKRFVFAGLSLLLFLSLLIYLQPELPTTGGPYTVGRTTLRWVDTARPEVLTEDPEDFREVVVRVWYPAEPDTGGKAGYFPDLSAVFQSLVESGEVTWWQASALRFVRSDSPLDARPLKAHSPYPVVIFSPGNGTNIEFYSTLAIEIASHGYIVMGLNHPYDVPAVELSDGRVAPYDKAQWSLTPDAHRAYTTERMQVRIADMLFVLERLGDMNASGPFAGRLDLNSIAAAGHSLGGIAASEACRADSRFRACLNYDGLQAGGPFSTHEDALPPEQPFLFLTKEDQLHPRLLERFEAMSESYWVVVHGASHQSFTDGPMLQSMLLPGGNRANQLMDLIQKYSVAFLDHTLKGQSTGLLHTTVEGHDASVRVFPSD